MRIALLAIWMFSSGCREPAADTPNGSDPSPVRASETSGEPRREIEPNGPTAEQMAHHFDHATRARDALVRGDLEGARTAARELTRIETSEVPASWTPHLAPLERAARGVADAMDLDAAALAFGEVARACGSCHRALEARVSMTDVPPPLGDDLRSHMQKHLWATDRIWEGLIVPSNTRFVAGCGALADAPLDPAALMPNRTASPEVSEIANHVHDLGRNCSRATDGAVQAQFYGELLRTCADCHRRVGAGGPTAPAEL